MNYSAIQPIAQVTKVQAIEGSGEGERGFVVCNNTDSVVYLWVLPYCNEDDDYVEIAMTPGWNPIICRGYEDAPSDTFLIGY